MTDEEANIPVRDVDEAELPVQLESLLEDFVFSGSIDMSSDRLQLLVAVGEAAVGDEDITPHLRALNTFDTRGRAVAEALQSYLSQGEGATSFARVVPLIDRLLDWVELLGDVEKVLGHLIRVHNVDYEVRLLDIDALETLHANLHNSASCATGR